MKIHLQAEVSLLEQTIRVISHCTLTPKPEGVGVGEGLSSPLGNDCCSVTSDTVREWWTLETVWARRRGEVLTKSMAGSTSAASSSGMDGCGSPVLKSRRGFLKVQRRRKLPPCSIFLAFVGEKNSVILRIEKPLRRRNNLPTFFLSSCSVSLSTSISLLRLSLLAPEDLHMW